MAKKRMGETAWNALTDTEQQKAGDDLKSQASRMLQRTRKQLARERTEGN